MLSFLQWDHPPKMLYQHGNKRHQHQFIVVLNNWTFRSHHWDEFCIKTLVWRHTKFNWFRSWSPLTIQFVFASLSGPAIDLQKTPILAKNIIFSDEAHFDLGDYLHTYIHNWSLQLFSQDYGLASFTTDIVCVNFYTWVVGSTV